MSQTVQEKEEPEEIKVDKSISKGTWQRTYNGESSLSFS